tara:strand:+ start:217 stop:552 length:336 start_codon:yes stop_codon:yes gene_type:complete
MNNLYHVWRVNVDAEDDPPNCGSDGYDMTFTSPYPDGFVDYNKACQWADAVMKAEQSPQYGYFVVSGTGSQMYSTAYIKDTPRTREIWNLIKQAMPESYQAMKKGAMRWSN